MFFVPLKQKKLGLFIRFFEIFSLIFCLDPDPKQVIPDPGTSLGSNRIRIHNSATGTVSIVKKMLKRSHKK